jgi:hypothetical protein
MKRFRKGKIKILIATEAAGMVSPTYLYIMLSFGTDTFEFRAPIYLIFSKSFNLVYPLPSPCGGSAQVEPVAHLPFTLRQSC